MFRLNGDPLMERFELVLVELLTPAGAMRVPIVSEWLELQLAMREVPDAQERREFFAALRLLCAKARALRPGMSWYYLHKVPGLKLRFRVGRPDVAVLEAVIGTVLQWNFRWLEGVGIGSVFDQAELLAPAFRDDVDKLLTHAADCHLQAELADRSCTSDEWAQVLVELLLSLGLDKWLAYEALARLRRLRTVGLHGKPLREERLLDPAGLVSEPFPDFSAGFAASLSLLQNVNLLMNIWGVDAAAQEKILEQGCALTRPSLMSER